MVDKGVMDDNVDYRLLERWQTSRRWRERAATAKAEHRSTFEDALDQLLTSIDRQRSSEKRSASRKRRARSPRIAG